MSDSNAAWEALNFLLKDYLDRQLPDDPAANYIRNLCNRKTRAAPPTAEAQAAPTLPPPSERAAKRTKKTNSPDPSRSAKIRAGIARRKAELAAQQTAEPLSRNGSAVLMESEETL